MSESQFDELTDLYDAVIDWPKRLAREESFYRRLFAKVHARRVVDVACGTGRHAAMFHEWGMSVEGADLSGNMVSQARKHFGECPTLRWAVRSFDEAIPAVEPFDVAICVGNSLALAPDPGAIERTVARMLAGVRPGGVAVIQVLNLWALMEGPCLWQSTRRTSWRGKETLITKGIHRHGARGFVEFILALPAEGTQTAAPAISFLGLESDELGRFALDHGAARVDVLGGYKQEPYVRERSTDMLLIAERA
jgi:SAM-dependent methyltransferase